MIEITDSKLKSFSMNRNITLGIYQKNFYMRQINKPIMKKAKFLPITSAISENATGFSHHEY